jgi:uncharacterized protein (DUF983 family)
MNGTDEERGEAMVALMSKTAEAIGAIIKDAKARRREGAIMPITGEVTCPKCQDRLGYIYSGARAAQASCSACGFSFLT